MFITRQDILSTGAGVVVCENEDYYYMVKEITEGFAIERKLWYPGTCKSDDIVKAVWVGDNPPPESQNRYKWILSWIGGDVTCKSC